MSLCLRVFAQASPSLRGDCHTLTAPQGGFSLFRSVSIPSPFRRAQAMALLPVPSWSCWALSCRFIAGSFAPVLPSLVSAPRQEPCPDAWGCTRWMRNVTVFLRLQSLESPFYNLGLVSLLSIISSVLVWLQLDVKFIVKENCAFS